MSIAEKLTSIAENEQKVYDAGRNKEWSDFWDGFQDNGNRTNYRNAFYNNYWNDRTYNPKYNFKCSGHFGSMFQNSGITDTKVFIDCVLSSPVTNVFANANDLITIHLLKVYDYTTFGNWFTGTEFLVNINFTEDSVIGKDINFQYSPLSVASMKSVIGCLKNYSQSTTEKGVYTVFFTEACWTNLLSDGTTAPDGSDWQSYVVSLGWLI